MPTNSIDAEFACKKQSEEPLKRVLAKYLRAKAPDPCQLTAWLTYAAVHVDHTMIVKQIYCN